MGKIRGFIDKYFKVANDSGTELTIFDTDGYLYNQGIKMTTPLQVAEASIAYNDSDKALFTIPDGAKIYSITIVATTGFDGTTPTYNVGYTADTNAVVAGVSLPSSAGFPSAGVVPPTATASQWSSGVTSGVLIGTFAGGGSNTAGAGKIRIAYYV